MGTFREPIAIATLGNGHHSKRLQAIVDSGAAYTWIPESTLRELGVNPVDSRKFKIATGDVVERSVVIVEIELKGKKGITWVAFGDPGSEPLLGAITLEEFGLGIDPVNKLLMPVVSLALQVKRLGINFEY